MGPRRTLTAFAAFAAIAIGVVVAAVVTSGPERRTVVLTAQPLEMFDSSDLSLLSSWSDDFVIGSVERVESNANSDTTRYEISVERSLRGFEYDGNVIFVAQLGGSFSEDGADYTLVQSSQAPFVVGESFLLAVRYIDGLGYFHISPGTRAVIPARDATPDLIDEYVGAMSASSGRSPVGGFRDRLDVVEPEPLQPLPVAVPVAPGELSAASITALNGRCADKAALLSESLTVLGRSTGSYRPTQSDRAVLARAANAIRIDDAGLRTTLSKEGSYEWAAAEQFMDEMLAVLEGIEATAAGGTQSLEGDFRSASGALSQLYSELGVPTCAELFRVEAPGEAS